MNPKKSEINPWALSRRSRKILPENALSRPSFARARGSAEWPAPAPKHPCKRQTGQAGRGQILTLTRRQRCVFHRSSFSSRLRTPSSSRVSPSTRESATWRASKSSKSKLPRPRRKAPISGPFSFTLSARLRLPRSSPCRRWRLPCPWVSGSAEARACLDRTRPPPHLPLPRTAICR